MLRYYYINKEWMLSRVAQRVYRLAASLSVALFFTIMLMPPAGESPLAIRPLAKLLLLLGVLGTAITTVAMEYFLFGFDVSPAMKKVFWFCVMLFPFLGPALYCFFVYSRSPVLHENFVKRPVPLQHRSVPR